TADRWDLHLVDPLDELLRVREPGLLHLTAGKEAGEPLVVVPLQPAGMDEQYVVLLDRRILLLRCRLEVRDVDRLVRIKVLLALQARDVEEHTPTDHSLVRDRFDRALL